ncbi:uncharacterized protein [Diabrotica undecimpunctata]|uniref:uncharacterized protein n=1 Tax=Diabrotica undecimpunctata TaxID=50387 RepID=UPI003B63B917
MPFLVNCCVPQCGTPDSSPIRHKFPRPTIDMERFRKWVENINNPELANMNPQTIYSRKRVCHRHFEQLFCSSTSHRLHQNAVPTLYLTGCSGSQSTIVNEELIDNVKLDIVGPSELKTLTTEDYVDASKSSLDETHMPIETGESSGLQKVVTKEQPLGFLSPLKILKKSGNSKQTLSPRKAKLYSAVKDLHKKYSVVKNTTKTLKRRLFEAAEFKKKYLFDDNLNNLNTMTAMFIRCQIRESNKSKHLRRFSLNEKLMALTLYKQSAKSYNLLSKIFILPSKSTLNRLLANIIGGPGINEVVFQSLQETTAKMDSSEKYVGLIFDEMAIMPGLHFNERHGLIEGFEHMGENRDIFISDHILMFMVRGLKKSWKAPISYHFASRGGAKTFQIKNLLIEIIQKLRSINLKPITVICDQNNSAVINSLIKDTKEIYMRNGQLNKYRSGSFEIVDLRIYPIFDPPHLLKGIRNNLLKKNLNFVKNGVKKSAKWEHIQWLYESDNGPIDGLRVLSHITDEHIYCNKIKKMKVKNAAQIFSQRFSATLQLAGKLCKYKIILIKDIYTYKQP